ncbi:hypothetical protein [Flavobacterium pectinovorum]|uniref:hypothetical protein n=1 Tax=Flavobacterium pectinovorum TaxID=29533 RepID=UPI001FABC329|nr:hypothetical protein [Flavobacterium pectinovorum]MCI9843618.1 hypothetical protein [Flavobacterium pectinovorum]
MFGHLKYNSSQKKIITDCIESNKEEYEKWFFNNLLYPLLVIVISISLVGLVTNDIECVVDYALNGSLSLIGINVLFAMSSYLFRVKNFEKDELKSDVLNLSSKFSDWKVVLIVLGTILYVLPVLYPSNSTSFRILLFVLGLFILGLSINISSKMFMIRDDFYQKAYNLEESFDKIITEETEAKHGKNW